jgi:hypothetical protein
MSVGTGVVLVVTVVVILLLLAVLLRPRRRRLVNRGRRPRGFGRRRMDRIKAAAAADIEEIRTGGRVRRGGRRRPV